MRQAKLFLLCLLACCVVGVAGAAAAEKAKVRAITAFVRLDREQYQAQVREALEMLRKAKAAFEQAGYEVQTLRISTQPFPEYTQGVSRDAVVSFFREYDALAKKEGFDAAIGPAMLADTDDSRQAELLGEILGQTEILNASIIVAGEDGVQWNAVRAAAKLMKFLSEHTPRSQGNFRFAAAAMVPPLTPFYPASYLVGFGHQFAIGLQSANVVAEALVSAHGPSDAQPAVVASLGEQARAVESIAQRLDYETGWHYMGIDLSPAPLKEVSIADAVESYTGAMFGSSGTLAAAAVITGALREIAVKKAGYSGLMLPVLEDQVLAKRWSEGGLSLDQLLAYSAVCGTGLDVVPLPGDVTREQLERIIGDVATLAVRLHKPLSARLLPVKGKKAGDLTEFEDPFLVNATLHVVP